MNSTRIRTTADMVEAIAAAISERDLRAFDLAEQILRDWLIREPERRALQALIESAREATWALVEHEERSAAA